MLDPGCARRDERDESLIWVSILRATISPLSSIFPRPSGRSVGINIVDAGACTRLKGRAKEA
jgi:hypothetical protein